MGQYRQFDGEIRLLETKNPLFYRVELWLLNGLRNRNGWKYENLRQHMPKFAGTPLLIAYPGNGRQIGDGHNFRMVPDPETGELVPTFTDADAEHIVGALSEDPGDIRMEQRDGVDWIVGQGKIWKWYARELVGKIERDAEQGRAMSVSIETLVSDSYMEGDTEIETQYEILGTTILGDHVEPAVADARIKALQALRKPFSELKIRAASYEKGDEIKPKNQNKGVKSIVKNLTKQQIRMIETKLPGYTVIHANEAADGTYNIVVASKNGEIMSCALNGVNEEIKPEMLTARTLSATVDDGAEMDVGSVLERMLSAMNAEIKVLTEQNEKLNSDLAAEKQTVADMTASENKRRVNAAKDAANAELEKINSFRSDSEKIAESCIDSVLIAADEGDYTDCCDPKTGEWCGDERARAAVRDLAMQEQMKMDQQRMNSKGKKVYAFEPDFRGNSSDETDSLEQLYHEMVRNG